MLANCGKATLCFAS